MNKCVRCQGKGSYLGQGFMMTDCDCYFEEDEKQKPLPLNKIDRRSKSYKKAIQDIMNIHPNISLKEATKMFDESYQKNE